jgi:diacylglycerol kinase (ATP)
VTLESRQVSRLQGKALYALAVYRAVRHYRASELVIQYDDEPPTRESILLLSAMLGNREGSFLLAPHARLDDGLFDIVSAAPMTPTQVLGLLPRIALFGLAEHHRHVSRRRCRTLTVEANTPLVAHTDGETLCTSGDDVHKLTVRILPSRLRVKVCPP